MVQSLSSAKMAVSLRQDFRNGCVSFLDIKTRSRKTEFRHKDAVTSVAFSRMGKLVATADRSGKIMGRGSCYSFPGSPCTFIGAALRIKLARREMNRFMHVTYGSLKQGSGDHRTSESLEAVSDHCLLPCLALLVGWKGGEGTKMGFGNLADRPIVANWRVFHNVLFRLYPSNLHLGHYPSACPYSPGLQSASMSVSRHTVVRADSLTPFGNRPSRIPAHHVLFDTGTRSSTCGRRKSRLLISCTPLLSMLLLPHYSVLSWVTCPPRMGDYAPDARSLAGALILLSTSGKVGLFCPCLP